MNIIAFLHDAFVEYYTSEWLIEQLDTSNWFETLDQIGTLEQYPVWSKSIHSMCDLLSDEKHEKIIERYQDWKKYEYGLNYLALHHYSLAQYDDNQYNNLSALLEQVEYLKLKSQRYFSYQPVCEDLFLGMLASDDIVKLLRYSLSYVYLRHQSMCEIPSEAAIPLYAKMGKLASPYIAQELAIALTDTNKRGVVLAGIAYSIADTHPERAQSIVSEILRLGGNFTNDSLARMAKYISRISLASALDLAERIDDPKSPLNPLASSDPTQFLLIPVRRWNVAWQVIGQALEYNKTKAINEMRAIQDNLIKYMALERAIEKLVEHDITQAIDIIGTYAENAPPAFKGHAISRVITHLGNYDLATMINAIRKLESIIDIQLYASTLEKHIFQPVSEMSIDAAQIEDAPQIFVDLVAYARCLKCRSNSIESALQIANTIKTPRYRSACFSHIIKIGMAQDATYGLEHASEVTQIDHWCEIILKQARHLVSVSYSQACELYRGVRECVLDLSNGDEAKIKYLLAVVVETADIDEKLAMETLDILLDFLREDAQVSFKHIESVSQCHRMVALGMYNMHEQKAENFHKKWLRIIKGRWVIRPVIKTILQNDVEQSTGFVNMMISELKDIGSYEQRAYSLMYIATGIYDYDKTWAGELFKEAATIIAGHKKSQVAQKLIRECSLIDTQMTREVIDILRQDGDYAIERGLLEGVRRAVGRDSLLIDELRALIRERLYCDLESFDFHTKQAMCLHFYNELCERGIDWLQPPPTKRPGDEVIALVNTAAEILRELDKEYYSAVAVELADVNVLTALEMLKGLDKTSYRKQALDEIIYRIITQDTIDISTIFGMLQEFVERSKWLDYRKRVILSDIVEELAPLKGVDVLEMVHPISNPILTYRALKSIVTHCDSEIVERNLDLIKKLVPELEDDEQIDILKMAALKIFHKDSQQARSMLDEAVDLARSQKNPRHILDTAKEVTKIDSAFALGLTEESLDMAVREDSKYTVKETFAHLASINFPRAVSMFELFLSDDTPLDIKECLQQLITSCEIGEESHIRLLIELIDELKVEDVSIKDSIKIMLVNRIAETNALTAFNTVHSIQEKEKQQYAMRQVIEKSLFSEYDIAIQLFEVALSEYTDSQLLKAKLLSKGSNGIMPKDYEQGLAYAYEALEIAKTLTSEQPYIELAYIYDELSKVPQVLRSQDLESFLNKLIDMVDCTDFQNSTRYKAPYIARISVYYREINKDRAYELFRNSLEISSQVVDSHLAVIDIINEHIGLEADELDDVLDEVCASISKWPRWKNKDQAYFGIIKRLGRRNEKKSRELIEMLSTPMLRSIALRTIAEYELKQAGELDIDELAECLGISFDEVQNLVREGLPIHQGLGRCFWRSEINQWLTTRNLDWDMSNVNYERGNKLLDEAIELAIEAGDFDEDKVMEFGFINNYRNLKKCILLRLQRIDKPVLRNLIIKISRCGHMLLNTEITKQILQLYKGDRQLYERFFNEIAALDKLAEL